MIIACDFDGVIHDGNPAPGRRMGAPVPGSLETVEAWLAAGHDVIVHTVRGADPTHVYAWLAYFGFPLLAVTNVKPNADVFLDDKAVRFVDWDQAAEAVAGTVPARFHVKP